MSNIYFMFFQSQVAEPPQFGCWVAAGWGWPAFHCSWATSAAQSSAAGGAANGAAATGAAAAAAAAAGTAAVVSAQSWSAPVLQSMSGASCGT